MVTIKTSAAYKFGQKNVIPEVGLVQFDEEGKIQVPTMEIALELVSLIPDFSIVNEEIKQSTKEQEKVEEEKEEEKITTEDLSKKDSSVKYKSKDELVKLAVESGLVSEEDARKMNANSLKDLLSK
jgi:hypothetical protein